LKITINHEFEPDDLLGYDNALKRLCYVDEALIALGDITREIRNRLNHVAMSPDEAQFLEELLELTILEPPQM